MWTFVLSFTNMTVTGPTATHYQFIGFANLQGAVLLGQRPASRRSDTAYYYLVVSAYFGQAVLGFVMAYVMARATPCGPSWAAS